MAHELRGIHPLRGDPGLMPRVFSKAGWDRVRSSVPTARIPACLARKRSPGSFSSLQQRLGFALSVVYDFDFGLFVIIFNFYTPKSDHI